MMKQWAKWFAVAACAACASAQGYPSKQVRIIVPQAPAGASDALSRIIAAKHGEKWGQQVPAEFAELLKQDIEKWAKVAKDSGAKID